MTRKRKTAAPKEPTMVVVEMTQAEFNAWTKDRIIKRRNELYAQFVQRCRNGGHRSVNLQSLFGSVLPVELLEYIIKEYNPLNPAAIAPPAVPANTPPIAPFLERAEVEL